MFKEWFFRFIANIVMTIVLNMIVVAGISVFCFVLWIGMKSLALGFLSIVVLGLIGLGIYTFYEVKKRKIKNEEKAKLICFFLKFFV